MSTRAAAEVNNYEKTIFDRTKTEDEQESFEKENSMIIEAKRSSTNCRRLNQCCGLVFEIQEAMH